MPISKIKTSSITADAASVNLSIDANTLFLDVANNRVGVNTTSPSEALQVSTSGDTSLRLVTSAASSKAYNITSGGGGNYTSGVFAIRNVTDATTPFVIYQDNVGIGLTNPSTYGKLAVSGNIGQWNSVSSGSEIGRLQWYNTATNYDNGSIRMLVGAGQVNRGELGFYVNNGASQQLALYIDYGQSLGLGGNSTPDRPVHLKSAGSRNYFKAETTVNSISYECGFETKTPTANFLIGSWGNTSALWIYDINATAERLRVDPLGRILIGAYSNNGGGKLDVVSESGSNAVLSARSVNAGTGDGTADVTVTRAVTNGAQWWANARYDAFSHAWGYGGGATVSTAMKLTGTGQLVVGKNTATANTSLSLDGSGAFGGADIAQIYVGTVKNTQNMGNGAVILHKLGQSQGLQFSGKVICNSWTGQAYIDVHIIARYTDDAVSYQVMQASTLNPGTVGKIVLQLSTVTISGVSGTFLAITKNGGGTGTVAVDGFCQNNVGFFYEVAGGSYTVASTIATLN